MEFQKRVLQRMPLLLRFFIILVTLSLVSCGTIIQVPVDIKNEDLYYLKEASDAEWAVMMHFLTSGQSQVTKDEWDKMSQGMVAMQLSAFEDFNAEIAKLCSQVTCNYKTLKKLNGFFSQLQGISGGDFRKIK